MAVQRRGEPSRVLVVCKGNICRSPLAGAVMARIMGQDAVRDRGLKAKNGTIAAKKVREFAETIGYNLSEHRAVQVTTEDLEWAQLILYMDGSNLRMLNVWEPDCPMLCLGHYIDLPVIKDPAYEPRGPKLTAMLTRVVAAAKKAAETLR